MSWYVVLTKPRQELRAQEHLQQQNGITFLPMLKIEKVQQGKRKVKTEPLFPGYLFLQTAADNPLLSKVRSTPGVRQLLMFAGKAITVDERLIADLKQRTEIGEDVALFASGQKVALNDGPFKHYQAIFKQYKGEERAVILLTLLGQQNELIVQLDELHPFE